MKTQRIPFLILLLISAATVAVQPVPIPGPVRADTRSAGVPNRPMAAADPTDGSRLELAGGRFVVEVDWKDFALRTGRGVAVPHRANTGHFWFFRPEDLDLTVKVVDGREMNGHFWIYYGAVSNVGFTLRISDRVTGRTKTYFGPVGRFVSVGDVLAFPAP